MKRIVATLIAAAAGAAGLPAQASTNVGVSIGVYQPGVYGRIDIGNVAPPPVVYAQPVVIAPVRGVPVQPVYLYVPPGHQKKWSKHCGEYNACGRPVYFVRESWIQENAGRGPGGDDHPGRGRGHGHGKHGRD